MNFLQIITPINLSQEREKFFNSLTYNPRLEYNWDPEKIQQYTEKNSRRKKFVDAIIEQDTDTIIRCARKQFCVEENSELLTKAQNINKTIPQVTNAGNIEDIVEGFQKAFKFFDIQYDVTVTDQEGFNFRPNHVEKEIVISKHVNLQFFSIDGEIKHELTHILRAENKLFNSIKRSKQWEPTEEGLACYMQDYHGENGHASLFQHAAEYVASHIGLHGSMRDIYNYLCSIGFSKTLAWQRGIRHKFGFIDTAKPGDILKPAMYFTYEQKVAQLNPEERLKLFVGKISIYDIENYSEYRGKFSREKIEEFYA